MSNAKFLSNSSSFLNRMHGLFLEFINSSTEEEPGFSGYMNKTDTEEDIENAKIASELEGNLDEIKKTFKLFGSSNSGTGKKVINRQSSSEPNISTNDKPTIDNSIQTPRSTDDDYIR